MLRRVGSGRWRFASVAGLLGTVAVMATISSPAEARRRHHGGGRGHVAQGGGYAPPFSAMVVDANSGRTLYAVSEDAPRHPASITKVMTLYLLFEQLERGAIALDTELKVSARASAQAPSKLGLRPGDTIEVEDAIKAIVTKSANDVACTIAENLAGSEEAFADRMTRKARQLGMSGTTYRNASGLPNPEQITTARDLTILARAIQERFPKQYRYFGTRSFNFAGHVIGNHNRLLGRVEGVDGIKTGFTNASGFNLMTSARTEGRHVVGVVLGGRSGASRDAIMANLVRTQLARATTSRSSSVLADAGERRRDRAPEGDVETTAATTPVRPRIEAPTARAVASISSGAAAVTPANVKAAPPLPPTALASAAATVAEAAARAAPPQAKIEARLPSVEAIPEPPARITLAKAEPETRPEPKREAEPRREAKVAPVTPWVIQLAAEDNERQAQAVLDQALTKSGRLLANAAPFTERVVRGSATLYRARFSGFAEADSAQDACRALKRSGFACFATRS